MSERGAGISWKRVGRESGVREMRVGCKEWSRMKGTGWSEKVR